MATNTRLNNGDVKMPKLSVKDQSSSKTTDNNNNNNNMKNKEMIQRPYQQWQGNNTICCDGRIIGGPQKQNFFYTLALILVPSILFIAFVCPNFITEYNIIYPLIIYILLLMVSLISFTMTAFSDPGIIPRGILPSSVNYKGPIHLKQRMCINGNLIEIKWCGTCHVFRPPRSFHCYICNNCVERFDHHCPWIGNCIGIRNYAYFSIFVNSLQLVCFWALGHCIYIIYLRATSLSIIDETTWKQFVYALKYEYMAFVTSIYVFIGMWFVIGLTWFHWFLVFVGKTTNEQLRNLHPAGSPFKRSFIGNIIDMCCKLPKSSVHLHHVSPTASFNELYINKQKVILLDNDQVKQHQESTHSMHIERNSPLKNCLINNFGYNPYQKNKHHKSKHKKPSSSSNNHLVNGLNKAMEYAEMIDHEKTNGNDNHNKNKDNLNRNGVKKNGYSTHIQMTNRLKNGHDTNGYHHDGDTQNIDNDGKIEEEEEEEEEKKAIIEEQQPIASNITTHTINIITDSKNTDEDSQIVDDVDVEEEEEENKYENVNDVENPSSDDDENNNNNNLHHHHPEKSKSRKDDNVDQERLYTSYDDEDDDEDENGMDHLNQPTQFNYSRSVTPDPTPIMNDDDIDDDDDVEDDVDTNLNKPKHGNHNNSFLSISQIGVKLTNNNSASNHSVPSESPRSANDIVLTEYDNEQ